jgi:hypothetical protein
LKLLVGDGLTEVDFQGPTRLRARVHLCLEKAECTPSIGLGPIKR